MGRSMSADSYRIVVGADHGGVKKRDRGGFERSWSRGVGLWH